MIRIREPNKPKSAARPDSAGRPDQEAARGIPEICDAAVKRGIEVRHVEAKHARKYVSTSAPQGIAALVERPVEPAAADIFSKARRVLVLDGLNDPGNVGTLVRTAMLLGWDAVFFTPGSASPYGEKAVRASAGAIGFIPVATASSDLLRENADQNAFAVLLADPAGPSSSLLSSYQSLKLCLVLGSEAHGARHAWPGAIRVSIPIRHCSVDSLGVTSSGAILMGQFR